MDWNTKLFDFIQNSPTAFHAVREAARQLDAAGFTPLQEAAPWQLQPGGRYYVTRNCSSLIAFQLPAGSWRGFMMAAAHCDAPGFKVKENLLFEEQGYTRLAVEPYGGALYHSWMDRPLSVAGRVIVRRQNRLKTRLVDFGEPCAVLPNVAIHMNRTANEGTALNPATDLQPLYGGSGEQLRSRLQMAAGGDIQAADLFVYNPQRGVQWGSYLSAPRLDDLQCAFAALAAFLGARAEKSAAVLCLFDNEEVGSTTKQGAAGSFLLDVLDRICEAEGIAANGKRQKLACSFLVSCDNGHAVHPAHPELRDPTHCVTMNGGVVLKYNAAQKYTTDGMSAALFTLLCERAGVPFQRYANRADLRGGGTLGNIANTQVSLNTVDVGLAQLAMHSAWETAGAEDTAHLIGALTELFQSSVESEADGCLQLV